MQNKFHVIWLILKGFSIKQFSGKKKKKIKKSVKKGSLSK